MGIGIIFLAFISMGSKNAGPNGGICLYIELEPIFRQDGAEAPIDRSFPLEDPAVASEVRVTGRIYNRSGVVRFSAVAGYRCSAACARCNRPISFDAEVRSEHILLAHAEHELSDPYILTEDMRLDPDALIAEDLFLEMPARFLCREDCKGLCPSCGADLNEGPCACEAPKDPRWDALKDLF